jgi:hypothetical protein
MAAVRTSSARSEVAYQALGFMGQAGYNEEADDALPLCRTTWGDDKLLRAALAGRRGGPPPSHSWRGRTRLMAACHFCRLPRVLLLLSNGAPLEQRDAFGGTAMAAAVVAPYDITDDEASLGEDILSTSSEGSEEEVSEDDEGSSNEGSDQSDSASDAEDD